ncbi:TRF-like 8 [Striga hermonthica]|uniref:TRF-like 8 n=1 Tax=Striga hermonthica TaxID=68872 RepID=A0A9N7NPV8_STRHE|nr:TRF-like 8 [Striga hermonthica]
MEDEPPTIGFEDGSIDVERLLVESQDGHVLVDNVMCLNEKIPEKATGMDDISRNFGVTNTGVARERENILNCDVLDSVSSEADVGYFRLQNDFCSMGEDYLLGYTGVGFSECMTNLDYGPSEGLLTSVSDSSILASTASPWKADLFRINIDTTDFGDVPTLCNESETPTDEKSPKSPESSTSQDTDKFQNVPTNSQEMLPNKKDACFSPLIEPSLNLKNKKDDEFGPMGPNVERNRSEIMLTQADCTVGRTTQKRMRRPTQRYIDELMDPIPRVPKRRREVSYSTGKDNKSFGIKDHRKCRGGSKALAFAAEEESSVVAIQVPFGSLVHKECPKSPSCDMNKEIGTWHKQMRSADRGHPSLKSKDICVTPENKKIRDECVVAAYHPVKIDRCSITPITQVKRSEECMTSQNPKINDFVQAMSPKKDNCMKTASKVRREDYLTEESSEEVSGRRKHHRLWTIAEVKKLIDGVSEYGVGRWSRIKKLSFSASDHRTSVDLKDKWRNLLKASRMQLGNQKGETKRNMPWRPLPKSILRRVCELANMYPYPKGHTKHKIQCLRRIRLVVKR